MMKSITLPDRWSMFFKQLIKEIYKLGVDSLWIVIIISVFIGTVIAIQISLNISSPLIPKFTIGYTTREIILLEFSSSIMALILAGKVGSNIASEIGTMRVTEQIDAMEIMGVNSANFLILPEAPFDLDEICSELVKARLKGRFSSMIVVSEGAAHAADVAKYIGEKTGFDTKSVVLGYTQRGGNPSQSDRILASRLAEQAVRLLYKGVSNRTVGIQNNHVVDMDIEEALKVKKKLDVDLYKLCQTLMES